MGAVRIGGAAPIVVQSMTNTDTEDAQATARQVEALARAGSELVRITVNTPQAAAQVPRIRELLDSVRCTVPLIGDFHYNGHKLLTQYPDCARALAKYRINPGNVGRGAKRDEQFATLIECALRHDKPVRIGVNWGSLDPELLARMMDENAQGKNPLDSVEVMREAVIRSALESARAAEDIGLPAERIVLSCKMSQVQDLIAVYRALASRCDYALHLGLTEAGMGSKGIVASTAALAVLLQEGEKPAIYGVKGSGRSLLHEDRPFWRKMPTTTPLLAKFAKHRHCLWCILAHVGRQTNLRGRPCRTPSCATRRGGRSPGRTCPHRSPRTP